MRRILTNATRPAFAECAHTVPGRPEREHVTPFDWERVFPIKEGFSSFELGHQFENSVFSASYALEWILRLIHLGAYSDREEIAKMMTIGRAAALILTVGLGLGVATSAQAKSVSWTGTIRGVLEQWPIPYEYPGDIHGQGVVDITGAGPHKVVVAKRDFFRKGSYVIPSTYHVTGFPYSTSWHTLYNAKGSFFAGGGPGSTTFLPPADTPPRLGTIKVTQGANQFGGTMAILGQFRNHIVSAATWGGYYSGTVVNDLGTVTPPGGPTFGRTNVAVGTFAHTLYPTYTFVVSAIASWGGWTTGQIQVKAPAPVYTTTSTITGYDNRTPHGAGNLQMVTGLLVHYQAGGLAVDDPAGHYTVKFSFTHTNNSPALSVPAIGLLAVAIIGSGAFVARQRRS